MSEHDDVRWLHRRAGFGLPPAQLKEAEARGAAIELERLLQPATAATDPWDDARLPIEPNNRDAARYAVQTWVQTIVSTTSPLIDRVAWMWHGHFVSALDKVRVARLMVEQVRLFRRAGLGSFRELVRAVTIDPAMLVYLDLRTSTGEHPNENYARELLELFTLGEGNYTEADVQAGAAALTGWSLRRGEGGVRFHEGLHDDTPQRFLGVDGVHDLDTVVDAVLAHESLAGFVASAAAAEFLGAVDPTITAALAEVFAESGFDVSVLVAETLRRGLAGEHSPLVLAPVPWFAIACRVTGAEPDPQSTLLLLRASGQLPMLPPNVAGWPGGPAWFSASSLVARANLAGVVAAATPEGEVLAAAQSNDHEALADVLGLASSGFGAESVAALRESRPGVDRLAVALVTPEFVIA